MLAVKHPLSLIRRPSRLERAKQNAANPQTAVGNFEKRGTRKNASISAMRIWFITAVAY